MNSLGVSDRLRKGGERQICLSLAYYLSFGQEFSEVTEIHIFIIMTTFQSLVGVVSFLVDTPIQIKYLVQMRLQLFGDNVA